MFLAEWGSNAEYGSRRARLQSEAMAKGDQPRETPGESAPRGLAPGAPVGGTFRPQGSKSIAQRALVAAALCAEESRLHGLPDAADVRAARSLVAALGARVEEHGDAVRVRGVAPGALDGLAADGPVSVGESGTLARFALAAVGLCGRLGRPVTLRAEGTLRRRGSRPLLAALAGAGVRLVPAASSRAPGAWPIRVTPARALHLRLERARSSQELSALWLAGAAFAEPVVVEVHGPVPSRPYLRITEGVLARFGVRLEHRTLVEEARGVREAHDVGLLTTVRGPLHAPREPLPVEPDASSAAVALAAACLSGGALRVPGLGASSLQGDVRIVEHLRVFGCDAGAEAEALWARGFPRHGAEVDLGGEPDLAPVLAAVAAGVALRHGRPSALRGLGTLRGKESDRLAVLSAGLTRLGLQAAATDDELVIAAGSGHAASTVELDPDGDHRMVFAFALCGLVRAGVTVRDPQCVTKSWPAFWDDLTALGGRAAP